MSIEHTLTYMYTYSVLYIMYASQSGMTYPGLGGLRAESSLAMVI